MGCVLKVHKNIKLPEETICEVDLSQDRALRSRSQLYVGREVVSNFFNCKRHSFKQQQQSNPAQPVTAGKVVYGANKAKGMAARQCRCARQQQL
jgi:hypothetical protein